MSSAGSEAIEIAELAGLHLDPWEQLVLMDALGEREDGRWAAFECGLVAPRQNGKGSILEARELAGLFVFGERLIIHSAHEQKTASEHFRRLLQLIESVPEFDQRVQAAPKGKGSEAIELKNGQRIFFKTRTGGGGRGLTGDLVVFDEAMILPVAVTAALVPTMAARSIHGNPQLWYAASAVDREKHEHGVVLARLRQRALNGGRRISYAEWSIDAEHPDDVTEAMRHDRALWAQANPGLGIRISHEHVENEANGALGPREFAVERLGVGDWPPTDGSDDVITQEMWDGTHDPDSTAADPVWLAYDVRPDRSWSAIGAAGAQVADPALTHIEVIDHRPGTGWLVDRIVQLVADHRPAGVICDRKGAGASLIQALRDAGVEVTAIGLQEYVDACGQLYDALVERTVRHLNTAELTNAARGAAKRPLGDAFAWSRKTSTVDITPLVACTLAHWGANQGASSEPLGAWR